MRQVLLSIPTRPPVTLWMSDDTNLGDTFLWRKRLCTVTAVYGTHLPHDGACVDLSDRPHKNRQAAVVLDEHPS